MMLRKSEKIRTSIPLWVIAAVWVVYSQLIAQGLSSGYLDNFGSLVWDALRNIIPSIGRMDRYEYFDAAIAKQHASIMLLSMPLLFVAFLATDAEPMVERVRKKKTEVAAALILSLVASMVFISGFGHRAGRGSLFTFSLVSCLVTGVSTYCYRVVFCITTKR